MFNNKVAKMFNEKKSSQTNKSDFQEFLKILEDLEGNADHVAIGNVDVS